MCLTVPAEVLEVHGTRATVSSRGWTRVVDTRQVPVRPGDFVLVLGGVALMQVDRDAAEDMLAAWDEVETTDA
ncbi:MAG TPA: HypC/HybG/HupF family hydrogenase formation chaperone [Thermoplasmata archaeon]|nr:HypC/HybG/HupF family hydrogenase formation chaperone [Thermoplasmata archaeon]